MASVIKFAYKIEEPLNKDIVLGNDWLHRHYYSIKLNGSQQSGRFAIKKSEYFVKFNLDHLPLDYIFGALKKSLQEIFFIVQNNKSELIFPDRVRVVIAGPSLRTPVNLPSCTFDDLSITRVLEEIEKVCQSNLGLFFDDLLRFYFISVNIPSFH